MTLNFTSTSTMQLRCHVHIDLSFTIIRTPHELRETLQEPLSPALCPAVRFSGPPYVSTKLFRWDTIIQIVLVLSYSFQILYRTIWQQRKEAFAIILFCMFVILLTFLFAAFLLSHCQRETIQFEFYMWYTFVYNIKWLSRYILCRLF